MSQTITIKKWYKQTEMWIIPEDWDIKLLPVVLNFIHGKAHEQYIEQDGIYEVVNSKFISSNARIKKFSNQNFCMARTGDILTVLSDLPNGKALAKCFYVADNNKYAVNQRVCVWRSKGDDQKYLYYILNRNKYFLDLDDGVSQTHILNHHILKCPLVVPSDRKEQAAIASVLSDTDELIEHLENLITKKKAIKQGTMHQLLTGKKRLPGFSGEWEVKQLVEIANFYDNLRIPITESKREDGITPYHGANGIQGYIKGHTHDGEFVLIAEDGANDLNNYPVLYVSGKVWVNNHAHVIQGINGYAKTKYLSYALKTINYVQVLVGGTRAKLNGSIAKSIKITIPVDIAEQTAITNILSDMDGEIKNLEQKRDKYIDIKQGMMQQLLTGNIRIYGNK